MEAHTGAACPRCGYSDAPVPGHALRDGTTLQHGRYHLTSFLAQGGMGTLYLGMDHRLARPCVIKEMLDDGPSSERPARIAQFKREASILVALQHPHIVQLWDYFEEDGRCFLVEEYGDGGDLSGSTLSEPDAIGVGVQVADALRYLHQRNIVYRDLKPANVLRRRDGAVVLADFGIARVFDAAKRGNTTVFVSSGYAPPEQFSTSVQTTPASDVYALGATLHELLTGREPVSWQTGSELLIKLPPLRSVRGDVSEELAVLVDRCLDFRPSERPPNGGAVHERLAALQARWRHATCACGRVNRFGAATCAACGRSLVRPWAIAARPPGPFSWRARPPLRRLWATGLGAPVRGSAVLVDGHVWVACEDGTLAELDLDGAVLRRRSLGAPSRSTLVPHAGGYLVGTKAGVMTDAGRLYQGDEVFATPTPIADGLYVATYPGEVLALDPQGRVRWRQRLGGDGLHPVQELGPDLLASSRRGDLMRLTRDGRHIWVTDLGEELFAAPAVAGDSVVAVDAGGRLHVIDASTGKVRVRMAMGDKVRAAPVPTGDGWLVAGYDGVVTSLDVNLGVSWRIGLGGPFVASPARVGPWVVSCDMNGSLFLIRASDGRQMASERSKDAWVASPVADGNAIIAVDRAGTVHCFVGEA
jgi:eukaryotic-like serine/threonine-protein kinase